MKDKYKVTCYFKQDGPLLSDLVSDILESFSKSDLELFEVMNNNGL